ncbi:hypothetical protein [Actinomadura rifamycini]|uniref:hypothetical protein n=1 Tax=Actinomadura rifamycini TaxID=31962 RepID=UPI00041801B8|nr:hypothetical protein [Actinomadura rifamycini]
MVFVRRDVRLSALPDGLPDEVAGPVLDAVEALAIGGDGLHAGGGVVAAARLVQGRHLAAGSRYAVELPDGGAAEITVRSWDRARRIRLDGTFAWDGHEVTAALDVGLTARRIRTVRLTGGYRATRGRLRSLRRADWTGEARLGDGTAAPELALRVAHRFGAATARVEPKGARRGEWRVRVAAGGRGRGVLRPFAALGLLVARRRIRAGFAEAVDGFADRWNAAVPGLAQRNLDAPVTLRHTVTARAVPREWAGEFVAGLRAAVEGLDFRRGRLVRGGGTTDDVRLDGKHLARGARYRLAAVHRHPAEATVAAWDDDRVRVEFRTDDGATTGAFEVRTAGRPGAVHAEWRGGRPGPWAALDTATGRIDADLDGWWTSGAPIVRTSVHVLGTETLAVACAPAGDGWAVTFTETQEPREWARPLVSVVAALAPAEDAFRDLAEGAAERWNDALARAGDDPRAAAAALVDAVLAGGLLEDLRLARPAGVDDQEVPPGGERP